MVKCKVSCLSANLYKLSKLVLMFSSEFLEANKLGLLSKGSSGHVDSVLSDEALA